MNFKESLYEASNSDLPWELLDKKSILITGATGLIGSTISHILLQKSKGRFHIYAAGRNIERARYLFNDYWDAPFFHFLQFDVNDISSLGGVYNYIIHAASGANPVQYASNPVGVMKGNIYGVDNLLSYGISHSLERFLFISSGDVYGECTTDLITEEYSGYSDPLNIRSCYISAKRASESLCIAYSSQYRASVVIARPCHTYGPWFTENDSRAFAQFFRNVVSGTNIVLKSPGDQVRSWCYVVDCALAILYVLLKGSDGHAYNIADENSVASIKDFATVIAEEGGVDIVQSSPSNEEIKGFSFIKRSVFDTNKIKSLGWTPKGSMREKIRATISQLSEPK